MTILNHNREIMLEEQEIFEELADRAVETSELWLQNILDSFADESAQWTGSLAEELANEEFLEEDDFHG